MTDLTFKISDLKFTEEEDGAVTIEVDEETETYKVLVALGRQELPEAAEQQALELGLTKLIEASNDDTTR